MGDPILASNKTRRVDFALFMVTAIENDELIHEAPAIVGCQTPSALVTTEKADPAEDRPHFPLRHRLTPAQRDVAGGKAVSDKR